ncbi:MAG: hypothetical protein LBQ10_12210 [Desulfovibrio sp.]|nr:hypothetical protein [Desulfovibrio sp.]
MSPFLFVRRRYPQRIDSGLDHDPDSVANMSSALIGNPRQDAAAEYTTFWTTGSAFAACGGAPGQAGRTSVTALRA